jgi:hypothetical protein
VKSPLVRRFVAASRATPLRKPDRRASQEYLAHSSQRWTRCDPLRLSSVDVRIKLRRIHRRKFKLSYRFTDCGTFPTRHRNTVSDNGPNE